MQPTLALAALLALSTAAHDVAARSDPGKGETGAAATAVSRSDPLAEGTVRKVDRAAGKITLTHGPLANLGMPGMTMAFRVKDPAWLDRVEVGAPVRFLAENVDGALTVVRLETATPAR